MQKTMQKLKCVCVSDAISKNCFIRTQISFQTIAALILDKQRQDAF